MQPIPGAVLAGKLEASSVPIGQLTDTRGGGALGSDSATTVPLYENRAGTRTVHPVRGAERRAARLRADTTIPFAGRRRQSDSQNLGDDPNRRGPRAMRARSATSAGAHPPLRRLSPHESA